MPLQHGDIEVLSLTNRSYKPPGQSQFMNVKEIIFRVRGNQETIYLPLSEFTKEFADQEILRAAAEIVDLLEKYPARG